MSHTNIPHHLTHTHYKVIIGSISTTDTLVIFVGFLVCGINRRSIVAQPIKEKKIKEAHNPEVAGSNPTPATMKTRLIDGFLFIDI